MTREEFEYALFGGWRAAWCACRVCGHRHVAVYPAAIEDEDNQECPACLSMAAEPLKETHADS